MMWFSSGGTKSTVHTDSVDNINCLFSGNKTFVFVDPNKYWHEVRIKRSILKYRLNSCNAYNKRHCWTKFLQIHSNPLNSLGPLSSLISLEIKSLFDQYSSQLEVRFNRKSLRIFAQLSGGVDRV